MKALVKRRAEPGLWMEHAPVPTVGTNEVLIRIGKTGICGTDLHIMNWDDWAQRNIHVPQIVGHEFVGHIVEVGPGVYGYKVGDRVSGEGHITCGICRNCRAGKHHLCHRAIGIGDGRDGAIAEYLVMFATNLWPVHDDFSSDIASILDPFGNAVHCALSFDVVGEDVLITGAGPIGLMACAVCRHIGARHIVVTDIDDYRLGLAARMGASRTVNVARAWPRCASSAARRICTSSSNRRSPRSWGPRTPFSIHRASTPIPACSRPGCARLVPLPPPPCPWAAAAAGPLRRGGISGICCPTAHDPISFPIRSRRA